MRTPSRRARMGGCETSSVGSRSVFFALDCATALVGVKVVRPVGRSTLTPLARRRPWRLRRGPVLLTGPDLMGGPKGVDPAQNIQSSELARHRQTSRYWQQTCPLPIANDCTNDRNFLSSALCTIATMGLGISKPRSMNSLNMRTPFVASLDGITIEKSSTWNAG
jgi:hypothetical protein